MTAKPWMLRPSWYIFVVLRCSTNVWKNWDNLACNLSAFFMQCLDLLHYLLIYQNPQSKYLVYSIYQFCNSWAAESSILLFRLEITCNLQFEKALVFSALGSVRGSELERGIEFPSLVKLKLRSFSNVYKTPKPLPQLFQLGQCLLLSYWPAHPSVL